MPTALSTRRLVAVTATLFLLILVFLAARVHAGADPTQATTPASNVTQAEPTPAPARRGPLRRAGRRPAAGLAPDQGGAVPDRGGTDPTPGHLRVVTRVDERFRCMGCAARVRLESAALPASALERLAREVRAALEDADRRLTRFDPASDLCRLNADPRAAVPVSPLVARLARAAVWAGEASGGLVDATLTGEIEAAGYAASRTGLAPASLDAALAAAPPRRAARPRAEPGFARIRVLDDGRVARAAGVRLDSGGLGKGLAADLAAGLVPQGVRFAISVGGDLAAGGGAWEVAVTGARSGEEVHRLRVSGGVATSGIQERLWRRDDGTFAHHLLDPSTGEPAWTGLVAATAAGPSALEAEVLAKTALLSGPVAARRVLRRRGGVLQHEDGRVEVVAPAPVVRLRAGRSRRDDARPARLRLVAGLALGRARRVRAAERGGAARARDGAPARLAAAAPRRARPARAARAARARRGRRARPAAARRPVAAARPERPAGAVHDGLPAACGPASACSPPTSPPGSRSRTTRAGASARGAGGSRTASSRSRGRSRRCTSRARAPTP